MYIQTTAAGLINPAENCINSCNVLRLLHDGLTRKHQGLVDACVNYIKNIDNIKIWLYIYLRNSHFKANKDIILPNLFTNISIPLVVARLLKHPRDSFTDDVLYFSDKYEQILLQLHV